MTKPSFLKNSLSHLSEDLVSEIQKHLHEGVTFKNNTKIGVIFEAYKYELSNKSRKTKLKKLEKLLEKAEVQVVTMASRREKRQLRRELRAEKQRARSGLSTPGLIEGLHSSFEIARKQLISRMSFQLATDLVNVHAPRLSPEVKEPSIKSISGFNLAWSFTGIISIQLSGQTREQSPQLMHLLWSISGMYVRQPPVLLILVEPGFAIISIFLY